MKKILIAIPQNRYITPQTMKCMHDLCLPDDYQKQIEFFYGYKPSQVLNLIAEWGKHYHSVLLLQPHSVFTSESISDLLKVDAPVVMFDEQCALIKGEVFASIEYPHFSGDDYLEYFLVKARERFEVVTYKNTSADLNITKTITAVFLRDLLPHPHVQYLEQLSVQPKVIYDIGSAVLHWTRHAKRVWPNSNIFLFDATPEVEFLYRAVGHNYQIGVLTDSDHKPITFYNDPTNIGGNSYYCENTEHYGEQHAVNVVGMSLDAVVEKNNYPLPDMMKLDVQGAEIDVLRGATRCLSGCSDIILEAQHVDYNRGAPKVASVIEYMSSIGFSLVNVITKNSIDGDYHFKKV